VRFLKHLPSPLSLSLSLSLSASGRGRMPSSCARARARAFHFAFSDSASINASQLPCPFRAVKFPLKMLLSTGRVHNAGFNAIRPRRGALAVMHHRHGEPYDLCPLMPRALLGYRGARSYFNNTAALLFHLPFCFLSRNPAVKHAPLSETLPCAARALLHSICPLLLPLGSSRFLLPMHALCFSPPGEGSLNSAAHSRRGDFHWNEPAMPAVTASDCDADMYTLAECAYEIYSHRSVGNAPCPPPPACPSPLDRAVPRGVFVITRRVRARSFVCGFRADEISAANREFANLPTLARSCDYAAAAASSSSSSFYSRNSPVDLRRFESANLAHGLANAE